MTHKICVIGLGYIGLPTSAVLASAGFNVLGVDLQENVVESVNKGLIHIVEPELDQLVHDAVMNGKLRASTTAQEADTFILAVPTPVTADKHGDMSLVRNSLAQIAPFLRQGNLVILESTSSPGTTDSLRDQFEELRPDLPKDSVLFAHAPERVLPGKIVHELVHNDRIVGGVTPAATAAAAELYRNFVFGAVLETTARTAELVKLAENTFRDINIAYANELSIISDALDIDVWEVIQLANRHPRVNIMQPGPGVGGHCIAVDPWFIVDAAPSLSPLISTARKVNDSKPKWVINEINKMISPSTSTVLFLGLAFKPNIDDLRESPSVAIVEEFAAANPSINILVSEPNISELPTRLEFPNITLVEDLSASIDASEIVVLLVDHDNYKSIDPVSLRNVHLVDTRGFFGKVN